MLVMCLHTYIRTNDPSSPNDFSKGRRLIFKYTVKCLLGSEPNLTETGNPKDEMLHILVYSKILMHSG